MPFTKISPKISVARIYKGAAVLPGAGHGFATDQLMADKKKATAVGQECVFMNNSGFPNHAEARNGLCDQNTSVYLGRVNKQKYTK